MRLYSKWLLSRRGWFDVYGISEKTLQKLKNKHVEFSRAFSKSELDQKDDPIGAIYKKTMGFEHEDIQTQMEDYNGKPKLRNLKTWI